MGDDIRFRLLTHAVTIACTDSRVREALRFLIQDAEHKGSPVVHAHYRVGEMAGGRFAVTMDGEPVGVALEPGGVLDLIYTSIHEAVHWMHPAHLRVHAGMATLGGRRVLFVGRKSAGKTTLMLQLLLDGVEVHGDEMVLVSRDLLATPLPRRFHVRPGSFGLLPALASVVPALPVQSDAKGHVVHALSPTDLGRPWRIFSAPVDAIVFIRPAHGRESTIAPLDNVRAARRLMRQISFPDRSIDWVEAQLHLVHGASNYLLYNGSPQASALLVNNIFSRISLPEHT